MVVQREIRFQPEIVFTSPPRSADDNIIHDLPLLFNDPKLHTKLSNNHLLDIFKKIQETVESLPETRATTRSPLNSSHLNLRLRAVTVIRCLHLFFGGTNDVFATSVGVLDKFMSIVRIQEKYLSCVAAACYFISSKFHLEEEEIPTASELACLHGNKWTSSDLCRMEVVILKKLEWNIPQTSYLTFIRLFERVFAQIHDDTTIVCLESQIHLAECITRHEDSTLFKPSTLAFCVLNYFLEKHEIIDAWIRRVLIQIQLICDIQDSELFECSDLLCQSLEERVSSTNQPRCIPSIYFPFKIRSRPSSEGESELPPITEITSY